MITHRRSKATPAGSNSQAKTPRKGSGGSHTADGSPSTTYQSARRRHGLPSRWPAGVRRGHGRTECRCSGGLFSDGPASLMIASISVPSAAAVSRSRCRTVMAVSACVSSKRSTVSDFSVASTRRIRVPGTNTVVRPRPQSSAPCSPPTPGCGRLPGQPPWQARCLIRPRQWILDAPNIGGAGYADTVRWSPTPHGGPTHRYERPVPATAPPEVRGPFPPGSATPRRGRPPPWRGRR